MGCGLTVFARLFPSVFARHLPTLFTVTSRLFLIPHPATLAASCMIRVASPTGSGPRSLTICHRAAALSRRPPPAH